MTLRSFDSHSPFLKLLARASKAQACIFCQARRRLHTSRILRLPSPTTARPARQYERYRDGELVPKPLERPLGLTQPPQPGQNSGRDDRSWRQRRDDYLDYDKHMARRSRILELILKKNYYRDIGNLGKIHKGKSILAPTTPFRASLANYFPNLQGQTLASSGKTMDTTPVLRNKVSIVSMMNTQWAEEQCDTFVGAKENAELHEFLRGPGAQGTAQRVMLNVEENWAKAWIVRMLFGRLKGIYSKEEHSRYFLVQKGLDDEIRDSLGMWNSKVGYVYLVDGQCRVRWAGNGNARDDEKKSLVKCLKRLVEEAKGVQQVRVSRQDPKPAGAKNIPKQSIEASIG